MLTNTWVKASGLAVDASHVDPLKWNPEALEGYLRILVGCFVGAWAGLFISAFYLGLHGW